MKEADKKKGLNNKERKTPAKPGKRDNKLQEKNGGKYLRTKEIDSKPSSDTPINDNAVSDSNNGTETSEVYEDMVLDYVDDPDRSEETMHDAKANQSDDNQSNERLTSNSSDMDIADESDSETINDSVSSQGDSQTADEEKPDKVGKAPKKIVKKNSTDMYSHGPRSKSDNKSKNLSIKASKDTPKKAAKSEIGPARSTGKNTSDSTKNMKVHPKPPSDSSEGADDKSFEQEKAAGTANETSYGAHSVSSDDGVNNVENDSHEDKAELDHKIEEMETRIEILEYELREVAALEIALYSLVPEHSSSAHKVHTPARRLSRLYIYACKYWSPDRRASVARNSVSGLVLVAKSCGNDVSRLTFWLSNAIVLREAISQAFGSSCPSGSRSKVFESNGGGKKTGTQPLPLKGKNSFGRQLNKQNFLQFGDDWQETRTFTSALEKVESWIFSRIVESIWWQTLTPSMQSPVGDPAASKAAERVLGPALGDRRQGSFSINHWENAFLDALKRLCPVRAGGHECGCLPVLALKVMEQCIGRLDVAMFNAILRESAHEIPTDPISDPIVDSKVLPIPAGDLSFGSGAQLKNAVGHWTRWLSDFLGMDADGSAKDEKTSHEDDEKYSSQEQKCFLLLNALSDLLMLPKDMLIDKAIRMEVCPSISLPLVKRVLCNFTPDEFCPDAVPGTVLEAINAVCIIERRLSGESSSSFPYAAAPVVYTPPSSSEVSEKVFEAGTQSQFSRSASIVQRKGYTSDEELDEVESCLSSIIDRLPSSPSAAGNRNRNEDCSEVRRDGSNARYDLLREVWQATE